MAMYFYASKISAIACGTRCRQTVLQKSRGQRDRDKYAEASAAICVANGCSGILTAADGDAAAAAAGIADDDVEAAAGAGAGVTAVGNVYLATDVNEITAICPDGIRLRRRHSDQLDAYDIELGFHKLEVSTAKSTTKTTLTGYGIGTANMDAELVQYDVPKNINKRIHSDVNYENSVLGSGGIMYINGRIVSGPLDSFVDVLLPKNLIDFDKEFIFSFLLSSRLFLRPHELLGKLLSSVPDSESLESLVAIIAEWTNKFPYDYRDERMMGHVKHIVARCSTTRLEAVVSEILSALLKRLTDLERHEEDLRAACPTNVDELDTNIFACPTALQYAQILCRLEKKLAKHIGPEEFLQCSGNVLLDKQKKWDQPISSGGQPGVQDPKKTCNLETYLDWSARLRLFVCNEILQCIGIRDRSKTVELWSGVAQYCLLVGNYNSATAILETLESPPIARLKITWSKLQVTCQQLDCMQRHAEGHGDLWHKQAIVLNENHQPHRNVQQLPKTEMAVVLLPIITAKTTASTSSSLSSLSATAATAAAAAAETDATTPDTLVLTAANIIDAVNGITLAGEVVATSDGVNMAEEMPVLVGTSSENAAAAATTPTSGSSNNRNGKKAIISTSTSTSTVTGTAAKPNDWVVIPVFADIVKLALAGREDCLQRLPNGHININAFDRMAAIVGAFTKHMHTVKSSTEIPPGGEYATFCRHMQQTSKLNESELMMASFDCEEPNNAEKLMYDLN